MAIDLVVVEVAVFNCWIPDGRIYEERGLPDNMFNKLLTSAAKRLNKKSESQGQQIQIHTTGYNCIKGEYPSNLDSLDAIVVTGSAACALDDEPWIHALTKFIQDTYTSRPNIKLFGACFGHQFLSQTLLGSSGSYVEKNPVGWELGVQTVNITPEFASQFPHHIPPTNKKLDVQFLHGDQVVTPVGSLPPGWILVGESTACGNQGVYKPGRVLTFQGHAEYDSFVSTEAVHMIKTGEWTEEYVADALRDAAKPDDSDVFGDIAVEFMLQSSK